MSATCRWDCHCWDCVTSRRNSIRFALTTCAAIALAGGLLVAFEASAVFQDVDLEPADAPAGELVATS